MNRLPAALFVVDIHREHIAVAEAKKLGIPTFAVVDTNSDPNMVDFCIPANDDASRSIEKIISLVCDAVQEGLTERVSEKESQKVEKSEEAATPKAPAAEEKDTNKE
jgi:small subunit ribosomal protein S2